MWVGDGEALLDSSNRGRDPRPHRGAGRAPVSRSRRARAPLRDFPRPGHRGQ
jgi:hypothetical protein